MKKDQKINETAEKRLQIIIPLINCDNADKALFTQIAVADLLDCPKNCPLVCPSFS